MSSGTSTTSALSQLPSIGTSGSGGNDGTSRSASYFFGFLVTFAVLLVLFVVAGFVSRHRAQVRRRAGALQAGIGAGDPWVYGYRERRMYEEAIKVQPVWIERWFEDSNTSEKARRSGFDSNIGRWENITPLAAIITRIERDSKPNEGFGGEQNTRRSSTSTISSWLSNFSAKKNTNGVRVDSSSSHLPIQDAMHDSQVGVDVVVMISMPRSPNTWGYEFGVTNVPIVS